MTEQELDLFQVAAILAAEFGAGTSQIMGTEVLDADLFRRPLHYAPNRPIAQFLSQNSPFLRKRTQQTAGAELGFGDPCVDSLLDPYWNGPGANAATLAAQICDHPSTLALLHIGQLQVGQLPATQGAAH